MSANLITDTSYLKGTTGGHQINGRLYNLSIDGRLTLPNDHGQGLCEIEHVGIGAHVLEAGSGTLRLKALRSNDASVLITENADDINLQVIGFTGATGAPGATGAQGETGATGPAGSSPTGSLPMFHLYLTTPTAMLAGTTGAITGFTGGTDNSFNDLYPSICTFDTATSTIVVGATGYYNIGYCFTGENTDPGPSFLQLDIKGGSGVNICHSSTLFFGGVEASAIGNGVALLPSGNYQIIYDAPTLENIVLEGLNKKSYIYSTLVGLV
jgi:hypothetical protein